MGAQTHTFGCRLNIAESEVLRRHADEAGLRDSVIVNTCAVTSEAVRQARQTIRRTRREQPAARIVVTGCAAQIDAQPFAAMPEVDLVLGNAEKMERAGWERAAQMLRAAPRNAADKIAVGDIMAQRIAKPHAIETIKGHVRAFVQVQNGCDHRCTFCVIPYGRGNSRSVPVDDVVAQVRAFVKAGYHEAVLTGVDITSYGADLPERPRLGALVKAILRQVPDLSRLRLSSIDSVEADDDLFDVFANEPRVMPHLHLSLQAGDDMILKRMKRRHTRADAVDFCNRMRVLRPDIVFGADFIAGFPTETDEMFARTRELAQECGLTHLHVFPFSPRPNTPAARMPQVKPEIARERAQMLREDGASALRAHLARHAGSNGRVLTEMNGIGRLPDFTPVKLQPDTPAGAFLDIAISGDDGRQLIAA